MIILTQKLIKLSKEELLKVIEEIKKEVEDKKNGN